MAAGSKFPDIKWEDDDSAFDAEAEKQHQEEADEFEHLIEGAEHKRPMIRVGEKVKGVISQIHPDGNDVLVDLGAGKTSGILEKIELIDEATGQVTAKVGDPIEAFVVSKRGDEVLLSYRMTQALKSVEDLEKALQAKRPVKGRVTKVVKGGLEVTILGKTAFCPVSQIDTRFVGEPGEFLGQELEFLLEKVEEKGRNIVVSRAALLRQQAEQKMTELMADLKPDQVFDGVVREVRDFGAFVDIGGVDGMVHVSEISYARVQKAADALTKGDKVKVKVLKVERDDKGRPKISLSMKAASQDPWDDIHKAVEVGATYTGKVVNLMPFGAFIEIKPGIEGLLHVSEMSWLKRVHHPSDVVKLGDAVTVTVKEIDTVSRRISLSMKSIESDPWFDVGAKVRAGASATGKIERLKPFGAIIEFSPGLTGLLPISVIRKKFGDSYRKSVNPGTDIETKVVDVDAKERKILLTLPGLDADEDLDAEYREYQKSEQQAREQAAAKAPTTPAGEKVGSFGALLGAKLNKR
jgi:small subunit ribosomal protein S1